MPTNQPDDDLFTRMIRPAHSVPHARRTDPQTSYEAADSVKDVSESHQLIWDLLTHYGPMTDEEIFAVIPHSKRMSPSGARSRRKELEVDLKMVVDSGETRLTKSGRKTIVWRAV